MKNLARKIESVLLNQEGMRPVSSKIRIHPLFFPSEPLFREQFALQVRGTVLEGIRLEIVWMDEKDLSSAGDIFLESMEVIPE